MRNQINRDDTNGNGNGGPVARRISAFARRYDVCETTVRRMIQRGELRTIRLGTIIRVLDDIALNGTSAADASPGDQPSAT